MRSVIDIVAAAGGSAPASCKAWPVRPAAIRVTVEMRCHALTLAGLANGVYSAGALAALGPPYPVG